MAKVARIHKDKSPSRIHFLNEWLEHRRMSQADLVEATGVNKGTVSKWCSGALPSEGSLVSICGALQIGLNDLFRDPGDDWMSRMFHDRRNAELFKGRSNEELQRMLDTLRTAFPTKNGTNG